MMTDRSDGNFSCLQDDEAVAAVRRRIAPEPWTWMRQVHGAEVVVVTDPTADVGVEADASVSAVPGTRIATQVADCVPIGMISTGGGIGAAHAGWRGLASGVIEATANALREVAPGAITAVVGASIGVECYEFGESDLARLADQFGDAVIGQTTQGTPALNMAAGVGAALTRAGIANIVWSNPCTSCHAERFWSWRARQEMQRQAMIVELVQVER